MKTREIKEKIKIYKTPQEALDAKHEKAREFIKKVDLSKLEALHPTKNP